MYLRGVGLAILLAPVAFAQSDAHALLTESGNALHGLKTYEIDQDVVVEMKGRVTSRIEMPVKLAVSNPGKLRIESNAEVGSTLIVSDGTNTWMYVGPLKQYTKTPAVSNPETLMKTMNPGVAQLTEDMKAKDPYASAKMGGEETLEVAGRKYDCYVVEAALKQITGPGSMTVSDGMMKIWVDKKTKLTLQQTATAFLEGGALPSRTEMTQRSKVVSFHLNEPVAASLFKFTPPEGAREVPEFQGPVKATADLTGKSAAAFHLKTPDGQEFSLENLRGKTVLLDFGATWCEPCRAELPMIEKLRAEFAPKGLTVLGINAGEDAATVRKFLDEAKLQYPMLLSVGATAEEDYSVTAYPTVVLIDQAGKIVLYHVGTGSEPDLRAKLAQLGVSSTAEK